MEIVERPTTLVSLTERAATKIKELMAEEPEGDVGVLRVAIQGGGCNGFEYALGFDANAQEGDHEVLLHGVPVVVDPYSAPYLTGTEIDFVDGLQGPASRSTTRTSPPRAVADTRSRWPTRPRAKRPRPTPAAVAAPAAAAKPAGSQLVAFAP